MSGGGAAKGWVSVVVEETGAVSVWDMAGEVLVDLGGLLAVEESLVLG
jgi:hypothetical protein